MSPAGWYQRFEALMAAAMTAPDPAAALRSGALLADLPADVRDALGKADADGVRMSALLAAKLRFERLLRGCPQAERWFDQDPSGFSAAFRLYHGEVPPTAFFPPQEAALFRAWLAAHPACRRPSDR